MEYQFNELTTIVILVDSNKNKMKKVLSYFSISVIFLSLLLTGSCGKREPQTEIDVNTQIQSVEVKIEAENLTESSEQFKVESLVSGAVYVKAVSEGWIAFDVNVPVAGRYKSQIQISSDSNEGVICWIEDCYDDKGGKIYNITGDINLKKSSNFSVESKDVTPLDKGLHKMKLHFSDNMKIDWITFTLLKGHKNSPKAMIQKMGG